VAGEAEDRAIATAPRRPEIVDIAEPHALDREADRLEALDHQVLATPVGRADRGPGNHRLGEFEGVWHGVPRALAGERHCSLLAATCHTGRERAGGPRLPACRTVTNL